MTLGNLRAFDESVDWFDRDTWAEFAKANLLGVALPESVGGLGYGFLELCLMLEEQGRAVAPMPLLHTLVTCAEVVNRFGSDEQRAGMAPIVAGDMIVTAALNELGTSAYEPMTTATPQGTEWRLEGKKVCVPMAHVCERVLVPARVGDDIGLFFVKVDQPGVSLERQDTTNHEPQFVMHLDGATVEDDYRIGAIADGSRDPGVDGAAHDRGDLRHRDRRVPGGVADYGAVLHRAQAVRSCDRNVPGRGPAVGRRVHRHPSHRAHDAPGRHQAGGR